MSEKVTLTVYKNSPHIWAGGLEGEDLARWLIGKANAIRYMARCQQERLQYLKDLNSLLAAEGLTQAYADLGLSRKATDPILPLSEEAIRFDMEVALIAATQQQRTEGPVFPPLGFSRLPDLAAERAEFHRKTDEILPQESIQCAGTSDE
nr:hypothetical protein [Klebsiella variicola]